MLTFSAMTRPVATATPTGDFQVVRSYRWIPGHKLAEIERIEENHRLNRIRLIELIEELKESDERARLEARPYQDSGRHPMTVSSRRAVIEEFGCQAFRRAGYKRSAASRRHSRDKERIKGLRRAALYA